MNNRIDMQMQLVREVGAGSTTTRQLQHVRTDNTRQMIFWDTLRDPKPEEGYATVQLKTRKNWSPGRHDRCWRRMPMAGPQKNGPWGRS